jgi:hypothetical protein
MNDTHKKHLSCKVEYISYSLWVLQVVKTLYIYIYICICVFCNFFNHLFLIFNLKTKDTP